MKDESTIQQEIQIAGMKYASNLHRNNSGAMTDETGRLVRFGLGNISAQHSKQWKSSDLIGITSVVITPDMIGKVIGVFTAVEVKKEDWNPTKKLDERETAQLNFINWVKQRGGYSGFARSVDDLKAIIGR